MRSTFLLLFVALLASPHRAQAEAASGLGLETFDAVWEIIYKEHFDPDFNGVDWKGVKDSLRPRAEAAEDMVAVRGVIREMLATLRQSHFSLISKELLASGAESAAASLAGTVGLDIRIRDGEALVFRVEPGNPAELAGIRPGWILHAIDGVTIADLAQEAPKEGTLRRPTVVRLTMLSKIDGGVGSRVRLTFQADLEGATEDFELTRVERDAAPYDLAGLPTFYPSLRATRVEFEGMTIGVVHFSNWLPRIAGELHEALYSLGRNCEGIVLDLRGNSGGAGHMARTVAGHFFEKPTSLGTQVRRRRKQEYTVRPRRSHLGKPFHAYLEPVVILTDETTGSCSEVFTGGMQALGRARVIGERTAGATLPSTLTELPNGDYLQHAIASFVTPLGESLEGDGVQPDEVVLLQREVLLAGRDVVLEAALSWIKLQ